MENLSICQKYLICALNQKGKLSSLDEYRQACMVASVLVDMKLADCIELENKKIKIKHTLPPELEYLSPAFAILEENDPIKQRAFMEIYLESLSEKKYNELFDAIGGTLVSAGVATFQKRKKLESRNRYIVAPETINRIVDDIRKELLGNDRITSDIVTLTVLMDKGNVLKQYFSKHEQKQIKATLKSFSETQEGKHIKHLITYMDDMTATMLVIMASMG